MAELFRTIEECRVELVAHTEMALQERPDIITSSGPLKCFDMQDTDMLPVSAARASFGNEDKTGKDPAKDLKLMHYLADHEHLTPFEYQHATFLIEAPIFILRQIDKHRSLSANEISRRYTEEDIAFWQPTTLRKQSRSNKQGSGDDLLDAGPLIDGMKTHALRSLEMYQHLLEEGVCREQARAVLPQGLLSRRYLGGNLRAWANYVRLRDAEGVQHEHRVLAQRIANVLKELWPQSWGALQHEDLTAGH